MFRTYEPKFKEYNVGGKKVIEVDTKTSTFSGQRLKDTGAFGRKKFENLLFLEHAVKDGAKIVYKS